MGPHSMFSNGGLKPSLKRTRTSYNSYAMNSALAPFLELKVMENHSVTASFNGGLYQTPAAFHSSACSLTPRAIAGALVQRPTGRCADDTELNIFDAERYFSEDNPAPAKSTLAVDEVLERRDLSCDPRVFSADGLQRNDRGGETPTASSEASWNSKSSLLSHPPAQPSFSVGRSRSSGVRRYFRRSCPCSGKKSVDVEVRRSVELNTPFSVKKKSSRRGDAGLSSIPESAPSDEFKSEVNSGEVTKLKISPGNWGKDRSFFNVTTRFSPEKTFPAEIGRRIVTSRKLFADTAGFSFPVLSPPRDSLEVFCPAEEVARTMGKPSEFSPPAMALPRLGERDRLRFSYPASPKQRPEEDAASDTSSDLFEIETSLSTTPTTNRLRDSLDELEGRRFIGNGAAAEILQLRRSLEGAATPSVVPSECYPPSEASVEWSVVTAEGFAANFSSAASNYDEFRFIEEQHDRFAEAMSRQRRKANGLLGCRCEKAVSVGPNPVRIPPHIEPEFMATNVAKFRSLGLTQERLGRSVQ